VIDLSNRQPGFSQAVTDRMGGKTSSVLYPIEALFLDRGYQLPVTHHGNR
jgi:hypothetical protein